MSAPTHATVVALSTTPVKGLRLAARREVMLGPAGVAENRRLFLVDEDGRMVNGKGVGVLQTVDAELDLATERLTLSFPAGETVTGTLSLGEQVRTRFFSRTMAARVVDGPWAAALSTHAGRSLRLVAALEPGGAVDRGARGAVSLVSRGSVDRLEELAGSDVDPRRFRMLVEVDGVRAHGEDAWVQRRLRIGEALVEMHGHVGRCLVTNRSPQTGEQDLPTLELLGYRRGLQTTEPLAFGIYGEVLEPGAIRVGDAVLLEG